MGQWPDNGDDVRELSWLEDKPLRLWLALGMGVYTLLPVAWALWRGAGL